MQNVLEQGHSSNPLFRQCHYLWNLNNIHILGLGNFIQGRFDKNPYFMYKHFYLHYSLLPQFALITDQKNAIFLAFALIYVHVNFAHVKSCTTLILCIKMGHSRIWFSGIMFNIGRQNSYKPFTFFWSSSFSVIAALLETKCYIFFVYAL